MATVPFQLPSPYLTGAADSGVALGNAIMNNGQTIALGDLVIVSGGMASKGASNTSTNILGFAIHPGADIYFSGIGGSAGALSHQSFFGASIAGTAAMSADPLTIHFFTLGNGVYAEMSLVQTYAATTPGTACGVTLDGTTGIFVADTSATAAGSIVRLMEGVPNYQTLGGTGGIGDTGARVLVRFNAAALAT